MGLIQKTKTPRLSKGRYTRTRATALYPGFSSGLPSLPIDIGIAGLCSIPLANGINFR